MSIDDMLNNLLDTAEKDLAVSKQLYDKGYYAPSIFYIQQSVEKLVKYIYGKINNDLDITQLEKLFKKLGHNFLDSIYKIINKRNQDTNLNLKYLKEFKEEVEKSKKQAEQAVNFKILQDALNELENTDPNLLESKIRNLLESKIRNEFNLIVNDSTRSNKLNIDKLNINYLIKNIKPVLKAYFVQYFFDHYDLINTTRYPTKNNKYESPYKYYDNNNEFIKHFNYIHEQVSKIFKDLKE